MSTSRACTRCITKKRKCDHVYPTCGSCCKAEERCDYPPAQQRRGPIQGLAKAALIRVQQCEDAIWTLLCIPEVKQALQNTLHSGGQETGIRSAPTQDLDQPEKLDLWKEAKMSELNDILLFGQRCEALQDLARIDSDGGSGRVDETHMPNIAATQHGLSNNASQPSPSTGSASQPSVVHRRSGSIEGTSHTDPRSEHRLPTVDLPEDTLLPFLAGVETPAQVSQEAITDDWLLDTTTERWRTNVPTIQAPTSLEAGSRKRKKVAAEADIFW